MITWLSTKDEIGSASLYASNITLNTVAMNKFLTAYRVMVGIDDDNNIILAPLDKDRVLRGDLKEEQLQKISSKKTYSRISSSSLMRQIGSRLNIAFSSTPIKCETRWDDNNNVLILKIKEENK
ncbi:MAG: hypothetical protein MR775_06110 [Erysipelotrichaceae bacterium]|nr:hypothetical protein [Erysipelotrichaceae bacterium]